MKISAARELCRLNIDQMTLEQLQRHRVKLLDAWRESKAFYGFEQAVKDGYYKIVVDSGASGFFPRDVWLTHTLRERLGQTEAREKELWKLERRKKK